MSENTKSEDIGRVNTIASVSILLIFVSRILYYENMLLSLVLVSVSAFIYVLCFLWLFKRRENPGAMGIIKITIWVFIAIMLIYISAYL